MRKGIDIECRAPVSRPMLYWQSFGTGMISSSYELKYLGIDENVEGYYEFLTQSALSNQNITLRVPGVEISRIEKLRRYTCWGKGGFA